MSQGGDGSISGKSRATVLNEASAYHRVLADESKVMRKKNKRLIPALHRRKRLRGGETEGQGLQNGVG